MSASEILKLRKDRRSDEALAMARKHFPKQPDDLWMARAYVWSLYDHVKKIVEDYEAKRIAPTALSPQLTPLFREFVKPAAALRGDSAFSQMLRLANRASRDWREFLGFARWAGIEAFSKEDRMPYVNEEGQQVDSLETRYIRAIGRETAAQASDGHADRALIDWGQRVLDDALDASPNDAWLNYYRSKLHLACGETDHAVARLMPVLRRQSKVAWTWALLGDILDATRPDDVTTCLGYATQIAREEQEIAKTRIALARRLALEARFDEAAYEAKRALQYREQHAYRVPQELAQLLASDWYQRADVHNTAKSLPDMTSRAKALLQTLDRKTLAYAQGVVDHVNLDKALTYVKTGIDTRCRLKHQRFPDVAALSPGAIVEIGRAQDDGPPLDWRLSDAVSVPDVCETFAGKLERLEGKDFAFITASGTSVYVPPFLAKAFESGHQHDVICVAVKGRDKNERIGWRALRFV